MQALGLVPAAAARMGREEASTPGLGAPRGSSGQGLGAPRSRTGPGRPGRGTRSATHLSELEGRDDGDHDAHETDVEPIPVG